MKTITFLFAAGIIGITALFLIARNFTPGLEQDYQKCLQMLQGRFALESESEVEHRFEQMAAAKAKIDRALVLSRRLNRMSEGPSPQMHREQITRYQTEVDRLKSEARDLLEQLERSPLVMKGK